MADVAITELLHRVAEVPPGTGIVLRAVARVGRQLLTNRYLATYAKHRTIDGSLPRWFYVQDAARLSEPIPGEHSALLAILDTPPPN